MTDGNIPPDAGSPHNFQLPAICAELKIRNDGGVAVVDSRDVAEMFGKDHRNVTSDIEKTISAIAKVTPKMLGYAEISAHPQYREVWSVNPQNGQKYRSFVMNRRGWMLLVMSYEGEGPLEIKLRYMSGWDAMEEALRVVPAQMSSAISALVERFDRIERRFVSLEQHVELIGDRLLTKAMGRVQTGANLLVERMDRKIADHFAVQTTANAERFSTLKGKVGGLFYRIQETEGRLATRIEKIEQEVCEIPAFLGRAYSDASLEADRITASRAIEILGIPKPWHPSLPKYVSRILDWWDRKLGRVIEAERAEGQDAVREFRRMAFENAMADGLRGKVNWWLAKRQPPRVVRSHGASKTPTKAARAVATPNAERFVVVCVEPGEMVGHVGCVEIINGQRVRTYHDALLSGDLFEDADVRKGVRDFIGCATIVSFSAESHDQFTRRFGMTVNRAPLIVETLARKVYPFGDLNIEGLCRRMNIDRGAQYYRDKTGALFSASMLAEIFLGLKAAAA